MARSMLPYWHPEGEDRNAYLLDELVRRANEVAPEEPAVTAPPPPAVEPADPEKRDYRDAAERMATVNPATGQTELYGSPAQYADVDARMREAVEAYKQLPAEPAPRPRWEDEFLAHNARPTDDDARRAYISSIWFGDFGNQKTAEEMRKSRLEQRDAFDRGLTQARLRDTEDVKRTQRVSPGLAAAISANMRIPPEEAAKLRMGDPIVDAFKNGAYAGWLRERGQNIGLQKSQESNETKLLGMEAQERQTAARNTTQENVARTHAAGRAKGQGTGGAATNALNAPETLAAYLFKVRNVPLEIATQFASGTLDLSQINPSMRDHLTASLQLYQAMPPKAKVEMLKTVERTDQGGIERTVTASNDPKWLLKEKNAFDEVSIPFVQARQAVAVLGKEKLSVLATYGTEEWSNTVREFQLNDAQQAAAGKIYGLMTDYAHAKFGAALTENEKSMLANATGVKFGSGVNIASSPSKILSFLDSYKRILAARQKNMRELMQQGQ